MAGTSLRFFDAIFTKVLGSQGVPDLTGLVDEHLLGGTDAASLVNRAAPGVLTAGVVSIAIGTAGSGQTPGTYTWTATGGGGAGATGTYVVAAGGTVTAVPLIVAGGAGYTSAPTIVLAGGSGGTPATFVASVGVPTLIGAPVEGANFAQVTNSTIVAKGFDTGLIPSDPDQTWAAVFKVVSGNGQLYAANNQTGLYLTVTANQLIYMNTQSVSPGNAPALTLPVTSDYLFAIGWGSAGGHGFLSVGSGGALTAPVEGTLNGSARPTAGTARIGGHATTTGVINVAHVMRFNRVLDATQRAALYAAVKAYHAGRDNPLTVN